MDPVIKAQWIAALRSGQFKQDKGMLRSPVTGGYCCLGVLCHATGHMTDDDGYARTEDDDGHEVACSMELPAALATRFGITDTTEIELISMNDGTGGYVGKPKSFAEIADYIEENL